MTKKLTAKQAKFVNEYMVDLNATQAAIRAGYSKKTATEIGYETLRVPHVAEAVQRRSKKLSEKTGITAERVIAEIARLGFIDPRRLYDNAGNPLLVTELPDDVAAAVSSVETLTRPDGTVTHRVKLWDKKGSLELLGKHFAQFTDRVHHSGQIEFDKIERRIVDPGQSDNN